LSAAWVTVTPGAPAAQQQRFAKEERTGEFQGAQTLDFAERNRPRFQKPSSRRGGQGGAPITWVGEEAERAAFGLLSERIGQRRKF
jgi:hypothetical protein